MSDTILYVENSTDATKKVWIKHCCWIKILIQKLVAFLYTKNEQSKKIIKETIPALIGVAQLIGHCPAFRKVTGLIQSGHMRGLWARPPAGGIGEATLGCISQIWWMHLSHVIRFSPSRFPSFPLSLKINK